MQLGQLTITPREEQAHAHERPGQPGGGPSGRLLGGAASQQPASATGRSLTLSEVADLWQVSRQTVNTLRQAGHIPAERGPDGKHRFPEDPIRQLVNLSPGDRLLRRKQVSDLTGLRPQTITGWGQAGKLPSVVLPGGRQRRYRESDVRRLLEERQRAWSC
jgi:DNA-binding transcriptional MerR regulator